MYGLRSHPLCARLAVDLSMSMEQSRLTSRVHSVCRTLLHVIKFLCERHLVLLGGPAPRPGQRLARILGPLCQQKPARGLGQKYLCNRIASRSSHGGVPSGAPGCDRKFFGTSVSQLPGSVGPGSAWRHACTLRPLLQQQQPAWGLLQRH